MRRLLLTALLLLAALAAPAAAHDDTGELTVTTAEQGEGLQVRLEVGVLYTGDEHLAEEATVTAVLDGPDEARVGPVQLARIAGARYGAEVFVPAPGTWRATITSTGPSAEGTAEVEVVAPPATTSTDGAGGSPTTTAAGDAGEADERDGGRRNIGYALAGVAALGALLAFQRGRRRNRPS